MINGLCIVTSPPLRWGELKKSSRKIWPEGRGARGGDVPFCPTSTRGPNATVVPTSPTPPESPESAALRRVPLRCRRREMGEDLPAAATGWAAGRGLGVERQFHRSSHEAGGMLEENGPGGPTPPPPPPRPPPVACSPGAARTPWPSRPAPPRAR